MPDIDDESPTLEWMKVHGVEPSLDNWLRFNGVADELDGDLLDALPDCFAEEYAARVRQTRK